MLYLEFKIKSIFLFIIIYFILIIMTSSQVNIPIYNLELRFHPDEKFFISDKNYNIIDEPVIYYNIDDIYSYKGDMYYTVTYYIYYKENGAIGLYGIFPYSENLGYHYKDIERIKILYSMSDFKPKKVFFSAHAWEGTYIEISECEFTYDNSLVVYVAKSSHANHHKPGTYWRILGFANDHCSNDGKHIKPILIQDQTIKYKTLNKEIFSDTWRRFFMPYYNYYKQSYVDEQISIDETINKKENNE